MASTSQHVAADCRLLVSTGSSSVLSGESVQVDVWARFVPSTFAFASAEFDLFASAPRWTQASGGVIAGANVLGVHTHQTYIPFEGIIADDDNPLCISNFVFTPGIFEDFTTEPIVIRAAVDYFLKLDGIDGESIDVSMNNLKQIGLAAHNYGDAAAGGVGPVVIQIEPACPGDANFDGAVNANDLLIVLAAYGLSPSGDLNGDGSTNVNDLLIVINHWGACP